jgi:hypothetical protein
MQRKSLPSRMKKTLTIRTDEEMESLISDALRLVGPAVNKSKLLRLCAKKGLREFIKRGGK